MRLAVFCLLVVLPLSGCLTSGKRGGDTAVAGFDFGLPPPSLVTRPRKLPLAVEVRAPLWFDTLGIDYRLGYAEPARLREYALSRWAGPPALLIQQRLIQQLGLSMAGQSRTPCLLRFEVTEFSQVFSTPQASAAVLQGRLGLLDHSRRLVGELPVHIRIPIELPNAEGAVQGLTATVDRLNRQIQAWETTWPADPAMRGCLD